MFSFGLRQQVFFGKSLDSKSFLGVFVFYEIDSGEGSLSYHLNGVELRVKIALQKRFAEMISPNQKMRLIVSPQVSISHVSNEFNTVLDSLAILLFLVDVVASYPLSLHNCLDLGFLLGFEEEQVILRQNKIVLLAYPIFLILGIKWSLKENVLLIDRDGSIRCLP